MSSVLSLHQVHKAFGKKVILSNQDFSFYPDNIYIFHAPSGTGKTTLFNMIQGIEPIDQGTISYEDHLDLENDVSTLNQIDNLFLDLTTKENLQLVCQDEEKIEEVLSSLNILYTKNSKAKFLSKGEQNRLAFARVILEDKPIWLLDEPFANLNIELIKVLWEIILKHKSKHIILIASHDQEIFKEASIVLLKDGKLSFIQEAHQKNTKELISSRKEVHHSFKEMISYFLFPLFKNNILNLFLFILLQCVFLNLSFILASFLTSILDLCKDLALLESIMNPLIFYIGCSLLFILQILIIFSSFLFYRTLNKSFQKEKYLLLTLQFKKTLILKLYILFSAISYLVVILLTYLIYYGFIKDLAFKKIEEITSFSPLKDFPFAFIFILISILSFALFAFINHMKIKRIHLYQLYNMHKL